MPLRLDVKRGLTARSDRVKYVDQHPSEPWMLAALYNGNIHVWNLESQQLVKSFEVCDLPVRAAKFVARKNWVVAGSDDMMVRVFNYNTLERVHQFEAHSDYVRCIVVHPTQPFVLTSSDDMLIKLWDWDHKWTCQQVFEGHTHYVMQVVFNPKDTNTFASASLDRTVKVWQLGSPHANFSLEGHQRGVNCVDYSHGGDKPYLMSGADDCLVKIWDYQNKTCVQTLDGHSQNVSSVQFHPSLPLLLTGGEDCTVRLWHATTYRLLNCLNYGLDRVWSISTQRGSNNVCIGYDEGSVMVKLGREEPAMSMDGGGRLVFARHSDLQQASLKASADASVSVQDGERLPLAVKEAGACDIYPQTLKHNPNGRFVVACGDGEYIIYTAMALRNKAFGAALDFVWGPESSDYAVREAGPHVRLYRAFKERASFRPDFGCEGLFGGHLLGCNSPAAGLAFYDWETQDLVRRIEIQAKQVYWSEGGTYVAIVAEDAYFVLRYNAEAVAKARETKEGVSEDGVEDAFELLEEVGGESVRTATWVGDCLIYTNAVNRLCYYVGGEIVTVAHLDRTLYLLGYLAKDHRVYLGDKDLSVVSYELHLSVLEYQTAVMRRDFDTADRILPSVPTTQRTRVAQFLEKQGFAAQALQVTQDPDHKFTIAQSLGDLDTCVALAQNAPQRWAACGDLAQRLGRLDVAQHCLLQAGDFSGLLLQASAAGNAALLGEVGEEAAKAGRYNVAFAAFFVRGDRLRCLQLLLETRRLPEAALFARSYLPSRVPQVLRQWREAAGPAVGPRLADPRQYDNLFPGIGDALRGEAFCAHLAGAPRPAGEYPRTTLNADRDLAREMEAAEAEGEFSCPPQLGFLQGEEEEEEEGGTKPPPSGVPAPSGASEEEEEEGPVVPAPLRGASPPLEPPALGGDGPPVAPLVDLAPTAPAGEAERQRLERELDLDIDSVRLEDDLVTADLSALDDEDLLVD